MNLGQTHPLTRPRRPPLRRRSSRNFSRPEADDIRINNAIRVPRVVLVDEEGKRLGEFLTDDARQLARDRGLDLVEVAANANPPVCRIADYGKIKYERKRAKSESRRKTSQLKELKVRPKTDDHDLAVKIRLARKFLENGDKVKVRVWFRGREHAHHDIGADQCLRMAEGVQDVGKIESHPRMDGRNMIMVLAPI